MPQPWNRATDDARVRELHATGATLHAIAKEMDRHKSGVSRAAARLGLSFDRTRTADATQAKQVDAKARRAAVKDRLLTRIETILDRLEADTFTTLVPDGPGVQSRQDLDFVPPDNEKALATSLSSYLGSYERLEKLDADTGLTDAVGMLDKVFEGIRDAAARM